MTEEADFQRALDATPRDAGVRLVFADWLDDCGRTDEAAGQRWMAEFGRCPYYSPSTRTWDWWPEPVARGFTDGAEASGLPLDIHLHLDGYTRRSPSVIERPECWIGYDTRADAERGLASALAKARE